jgi:hypothetical protein
MMGFCLVIINRWNVKLTVDIKLFVLDQHLVKLQQSLFRDHHFFHILYIVTLSKCLI